MKFWLIPALAVLLLSCQMLQKEEPESGLQGYSHNAVEIERAACEGKDGNFTKAGKSAGLICIEKTRDANKTCTSGSQCEGQCLARSGTCSPLKPLFGCHEILTDSGGKATICID